MLALKVLDIVVLGGNSIPAMADYLRPAKLVPQSVSAMTLAIPA